MLVNPAAGDIAGQRPSECAWVDHQVIGDVAELAAAGAGLPSESTVV